MIAEDNAPKRKYFRAASLELGFFFIYPTRMYVGMLISSHATNNIIKSVEYATSTIQIVASRISE